MTLPQRAKSLLCALRTAAAIFLVATSYTQAWEKTAEKQILCLPLSDVVPKVDGILDAEEYADAVVFLASVEASYITGEALNLNGGTLFH